MKKRMWRGGIAMLLACCMMFSGCGKKEDVQYDANETIGTNSGLKGQYGIPEKIDTELAVGGSGLSEIKITDDQISVPDSNDLYVAPYKKKEFSNESKKQVAEAIFDKDQGIYAYDSVNQTKEDIQSEIAYYEESKEKAAAAGVTDGVDYDETIKELQDQLEDAPKEYPAADGYEGDSFVGTIDGREYQLTTPTTDGMSSEYYLHYKQRVLEYRPDEDAMRVEYLSSDDLLASEDMEIDESTNQCTLTEKEAMQIAEDFIASVGGTEAELESQTALCWLYWGYDDEVLRTEVDGYVLTYTKTVNAQAIADISTINVDNLNTEELFADVPVEKYVIEVASDGIVRARWTDRLEADGSTEPVQLLSFDDLLEKANETVAAYYETYPTQYADIEFNDMTLAYYLKQGETDGTFVYTPAWILTQYEEYQNGSSYYRTYPDQMVVLDATDGSVIDLPALSEALGAQ